MPNLCNQLDGAGKWVDPVAFKDDVDQFVLPIPETAHCAEARPISWRAVGERDGARLKEALYPLIARLAVHILAVIRGDVKWLERDRVLR